MKANLIFLLLSFFYNPAFAQLRAPINNCNPSTTNSESDACNSNVPQTYNPCLCNYYREYEIYRQKLGIYRNKIIEINKQLQNYRGDVSTLHLSSLTESNGFSSEKQKVLNKLNAELRKANSGLTLSYEKRKYCVENQCAEENISEFRNKINEVNNQIRQVSGMKAAIDAEIGFQVTTGNTNNQSGRNANNYKSSSTNSSSSNTYYSPTRNYKAINKSEEITKLGISSVGFLANLLLNSKKATAKSDKIYSHPVIKTFTEINEIKYVDYLGIEQLLYKNNFNQFDVLLLNETEVKYRGNITRIQLTERSFSAWDEYNLLYWKGSTGLKTYYSKEQVFYEIPYYDPNILNISQKGIKFYYSNGQKAFEINSYRNKEFDIYLPNGEISHRQKFRKRPKLIYDANASKFFKQIRFPDFAYRLVGFVGETKLYYSNGNLMMNGFYDEKSRKNGDFEFYSFSGQLIKKLVFEEGKCMNCDNLEDFVPYESKQKLLYHSIIWEAFNFYDNQLYSKAIDSFKLAIENSDNEYEEAFAKFQLMVIYKKTNLIDLRKKVAEDLLNNYSNVLWEYATILASQSR